MSLCSVPVVRTTDGDDFILAVGTQKGTQKKVRNREIMIKEKLLKITLT
jgi:hypothetical protein